MTNTCKRCGSKDLTMFTIVSGLQVPLCAKCTQGWWDTRQKLLGDGFEKYVQSKDSAEGQHLEAVARRKGRS